MAVPLFGVIQFSLSGPLTSRGPFILEGGCHDGS
jgi:hypothetical protein